MIREAREDCVFCKIISGQAPVSMVYEDDQVAVFTPLECVTPGHLLVIPKEHAAYMADVRDETIMHIMKVTKRMGDAIRKSGFSCEGLNLFLADGEAAGQEVFHFHLHVFPRYAGDGFGLKFGPTGLIKMSRPEMDAVAKKVRSQLGPR